MRWKQAMHAALYGDGGFFRRTGPGPAGHFRTSAHASPQFAEALAVLLVRLDEALERPDPLDVVDVGAGRGELITHLLAALPPAVASRVLPRAVELAPRPAGLDPRIEWTDGIPDGVTGLLVATEWLDNVPLDIVEIDGAGTPRYLHTDGLGDELEPADAAWLARWWPLDGLPPGARAEVGRSRDEAWADAVAKVRRGLALAVDYGHFAGSRPLFGTLTAYRDGREVPPEPDGSCDLTVAVALDSLSGAVGVQEEMLKALNVSGRRPPLSLAHTDPAGYVRALARASAATELTDPAGLGGHWWVMHWV